MKIDFKIGIVNHKIMILRKTYKKETGQKKLVLYIKDFFCIFYNLNQSIGHQ